MRWWGVAIMTPEFDHKRVKILISPWRLNITYVEKEFYAQDLVQKRFSPNPDRFLRPLSSFAIWDSRFDIAFDIHRLGPTISLKPSIHQCLDNKIALITRNIIPQHLVVSLASLLAKRLWFFRNLQGGINRFRVQLTASDYSLISMGRLKKSAKSEESKNQNQSLYGD